MKNILKLGFKYLKLNRTKYILYLTISSFVSLFSFIMPVISGDFVDYLTGNSKLDLSLKGFCLLFLIISLVEMALGFITDRLYIKIQTISSNTLIRELTRRIQYAKYKEVCDFDSGYMTQRINNDSNNLIIFTINTPKDLINNVLMLILSAIYIFLADKILFTIAIFMLFLYVILFRLLKEKIYEINFEMIESQSEYFKAGRINLSNLRAIKLKNFYDRLISIFDLSFIRLFKAALKEQKLSYIYSSLDSIIKDIMQIIIFIYGGSMVLSKSLTIGEFTVISVFFSYLMGAIGFFFSFFKSVESTKTSFDRIIEIKKIKGEEDGGIKLENIDSIKINNLTFGYDKMPIIDKLNIEFKKGLHIIKGINGSGKSTLFYLLEGLFTDFKGQILFDDVEIKQLNLIEFRKNNIDILLQSYDDENPFDDQFKKLSGGQKQLNALKDILKKDGDIILLDEAFSSLDQIKKKEAKDLILKFKNKKIIIAIMHDDYLDDIACNIINIQAQ